MPQERPETIYKARIGFLEERLTRLKKYDISLAVTKLSILAVGIFFLYRVAATRSLTALWLLVLFFFLFVGFALVHGFVLKKKRYLLRLKQINVDEIKALDDVFLDVPDGSGFMDTDHPYEIDIDLFGGKSLFHLLNRTATGIGKKRLAKRLREHPPSVGRIRGRQRAVEELSGRIDFRQRIRLLGLELRDEAGNEENITGLFREPDFISDKKILVAIIHIFPFLTLGALVLLFYGLHWSIFLFLVLMQTIICFFKERTVSRIYELTNKQYNVLKAYSGILSEIEKTPFSQTALQELGRKLTCHEEKASSSVKRLSNLLGRLGLRLSTLHFFVNILTFWDLHCVLGIEKWKKRTGECIEQWFDALAEIDALSSLANLRFNRPDWSFPEIEESGFLFKAENMGHPLIPRKERVSNDIFLNGEGRIMIVTGPNMAGKSTFLKTAGINAVLAFAGSPVCANRFTISRLSLYTSMKVSDSLDKSLSLFYAELTRLKKILDAILRGEPVFYLIDEMLKGTNALDRQKGAIALLHQLVRRRACGIVATHDLELTKLEKDHPEKISNVHFDGYIKGDKLLFDYRLKPGRCESFNALVLMKKIGIELE
ncbi:MAG: hypothetical protein JXB26_09755 [Candidatus Aminicenantes bacterium]|nr:hypothetical protein [Candidatus Aminicenantes bacterium]